MSEILIQSKITAPRLHDKIVHRERLTSLLHKNINKNIIIICATAGFGKTTLVLDYLSDHNDNYSWLSVPHKGIEDPSTFFEYIIGAIRKLNDSFGNTTIDVMKMYTQNPKMSKELIYACTASLVNEFTEYFKDDVLLVIDDLHFITSEKSQKWLKEFFNELVDDIPSNLHLIIVTRVMPDLPLTQLKAKRNVFLIKEDHLSFTEDETGKLLDDIYKLKYDKKDIKLLDKNIKGWITGLHLLLQAYGEDFNKVRYSGQIDFESIYEFFAQEIFDYLSPELKEFMMITSLLENFDAKLCNAVLHIGNGDEIIKELIKKNMFIQQLRTTGNEANGSTIFYSYHALFRNFLYKRLQKLKIAEDIRSIQKKIGEYFACINDEINAVNYFLEAGDLEIAVPLIKKNLRILFNSAKYDLSWKWINALPDNIINSDAMILFSIGNLYCYASMDFGKSMEYLNRAEELFKIIGDEDGLILLYETKYYMMFNTGKIGESRIELEKLMEINLKPDNKLKLNTILAYVYSQLRMHQKAIDLLENALELCEKCNLNKSRIYNSLAITYIYSCDFDKAIIYLNKVVPDSVFMELSVNLNLSMSYYNIRDYSNSIKYYNKALKHLNTSYSSDRYMQAVLQQALLYLEIGYFEESLKALEKAYAIAIEQKSVYNLWHIAYYFFLDYYFLNDRDNCLKYLKLNGMYSEELNMEHYRKVNDINNAMFELKFNLNPAIPDKFMNSCSYFETIDDKETLGIISKELAHYYLVNKDTESAIENLLKFPDVMGFTASDLYFDRILLDFVLSNIRLFQYKEKAHYAFTDFFNRLYIEGTADEYKRKMKIEIEKLYDINMKSFGTPEFMYRGKAVPESRWRKKKGKSILAFMMLNPKAKHNKDKIIDMFFPDAKPTTVEDSFKQAIFNIRSAFKNQYLNFLILEGKTLYLNPDGYYKSDADEFNKIYNKVHSSDLTEEEKIKLCREAIELYKGEFLEGNYEQWCEDIRTDFFNKYISISEFLLSLLCASRSYEEVIYYSENLLKHDRLNETAYLSLVNAYVKSDKLKSAREVYSLMQKTYKKELGEKPDQKLLKKLNLLLGSY